MFRASLGLTAEGPVLVLYDTVGKLSAALNEGRLSLWGANPDVSAALWATDAGPYLKLTDAQQFKAVLGVTETEVISTGESHKTSAAAVTLFGKDGKVIWRAP